MTKRGTARQPSGATSAHARSSRDGPDRGAGEALFFSSALSRRVVLGILFITALCARLYRIEQPPLEFHAARQYRSALIARAYYYQTQAGVPESKRQTALASKERMGILEPPVMEALACLAYRIAGGERLWIPRLFSSLFWLVGGAFLYLLAKRIAQSDGALVSTAFYLLLPYSIPASRGFQPDPLMIMLLTISLLLLYRHYEAPSTHRLVVAAVVSGLAVFVKPFAAFFVLAAFISLGIHRDGLRRTLVNRNALVFALPALVPSLIFVVYGTLIEGSLAGQIKGTFLPHLLLKSFFWGGWLRMIEHVMGHLAVIAALLGIVLLSRGLGKALLIGLFTGYLAFSLFCSYHTPTHDYYQLAFIPIVAVAMGPLAALVLNRLAVVSRRLSYRLTVCAVFILTMVMHLHAAPWRRFTSDYRPIVKSWEEVGEVVGHSGKTIWLASDYGKPLQYHAEIAGTNWPWRGDLRVQAMRGRPPMTAEERLEKLRARTGAEFFIVLERNEFAAQSDLRELLSSRYPVFRRTPAYRIYDLRE